MSGASDQRDFFREVERDYWAGADGLKPEEHALTTRHLQPRLATLDAGTGGGRLPRALAAMGFSDLTGFDFAPELIEAARAADGAGSISFDVADATSLPYPAASFDQLCYLQQVVCTIEDPAGRRDAIAEAARVLRPEGIALFSFVCLEARMASWSQRAYVAYLRALRGVKRDRRPIQSMPRLRLRGRLDPGALRDAGPYNWWYRAREAEDALRAAGLDPTRVGFAAHAIAGRLYPGADEALAAGAGGVLYVVCRRTA